eukprot:GFUD01005307.1.p1 GENE.GFUD01005307.1~~GFUD01005307.1.p1  ORF type:complete len:465 (+),score=167.08 GFUD01005307.1:75-1397(+)
MESGPDQVSHLLNLAAAMAAAQEKATGNGKLDMAGIMAVLALAQGEERSTENMVQEMKGGGIIPRRVSVVQEEHFVETLLAKHKGSVGDEKLENKTKENQTVINKVPRTLGHFRVQPSENKTNVEGLTQDLPSVSSFRHPKPYKKPDQSSQNGETVSEKSKGYKKFSFDKLPWEGGDLTSDNESTGTGDNTGENSALGSPLAIAKFRTEKNLKNFKTDELEDVQTITNTKGDEMGNTTDKEPASLSALVDTSDPGISQLLATVQTLFTAKEKLTGNGKLDLSDLVVAVAAVVQTEDTAGEAMEDNRGDEHRPVQTGYTVSTPGGRKTTSLTVQISADNQAGGSADWARNEAVKGAAVAKGVLRNEHSSNEESETMKIQSKLEECKFITEKEPAEFTTVPANVQYSSNKKAATDTSSTDQTVRKLVYSQYREMLKSYSNSD